MREEKFRAYGVCVLVCMPNNELTPGGVYLPEKHQHERIARGKIVSRGPGFMTPNGLWDTPTVVVGDEILFQRAHGVPVKECGDNVVCLQMSGIIAVLRDEELQRPEPEASALLMESAV